MKRILIVKTTSMGDVIHALPVLNDIHAQDPSIQIDWMVEEPFVDLVRGSRHVHEVVPVNLRKWRKQGIRYTWQQWKLLKSKLADRQYDAIVDLQGLIKSAVLARAAKGTLMGPGFSYAKESLACLFYSKRAGWDPQAHAVERLRELAAGLLGYRLLGKPVFYDIAPQKVLPAIPSGAEIWFLHATARDEKKWPIVKWRELAHRFSDLGYAVKLPWGSDAEQQQAEKIATGIARVEVLPRMALGELRLRLERAGLVIGVDTGITHLAAAHYLPMVALFFATPAWRFAPRFNPHAISLGDVGREPAVGEVFEAATRLLRGNKL
ncbi:MAG: lipopolysaccharide heptosyltransferase I [Limnobacter sp.]|mgnify:FL=1|jgi:heptosyltransferase I|uniref:Lipopolysaccharide heptosyltransferase 1 n=2 Tax=Limnobacter TaxID=131079 RepID=A0ABX6N2N1_9BURK|nr:MULTISPECIES: lipopolysaccharide heptosyltransferase I [unclassified Limnobacter]MAG79589.1 lipopolysaccharide heptosyltransferase I [Sutterellaceae bacterium]MBA4314035.1 lipopolysaccharide heptosyltransferase I [Alcaligenaceae bacterium]PZO17483.1 MAG: lipopolysaccharide heptosyltransferase I [Betaproteobacteria bacterium]MBT85484.1 lipopolysaccharide heptosyltransferase I [Sutterellaceae bacterium]MDP3271766.1 lipopolysaccharide heptosyltransferase I [Limnobacter sp.]|tara:strand:- start:864 stop:1829 length:966 start_codon:yes stop_codon:yes gene_type:complete